MKYIIKKKKWNKKIRHRLKYKQARKRKITRNIFEFIEITLIIVVLSFAVFKIYNFLFYSPYFRIKKVNFIGVKSLSNQELLKVSGLRLGENIFHINLKELKNDFKLHPCIGQIRIYRKPPNSILIYVKERMPLGLVKRDKQIYGLDEEGILFKLPLKNSEVRLPFITGLEDEVVRGKLESSSRLRMALSLINEILMANLPVSDQILEIDLTNLGQVIFKTKDYGKILLGKIELDTLRKKFKRLAYILEDIKEKVMNIEYIDIRLENIVVKPR